MKENDKFEEWWKSQGYGDETFIDKDASRENWNAAKEKRFGCHIAAHRGKIFIYAFCMYDAGYDCEWNNTKDDCDYWCEIAG